MLYSELEEVGISVGVSLPSLCKGYKSEYLFDIVAEQREKYSMPCLIAGVIVEEVVFVEGVGVRKKGEVALVEIDDLCHLGSCTKAMTALLVALLIEDGLFEWETTVGDVCPELESFYFSGYSIMDLACHRNCLPENVISKSEWFDMDPREARIDYVDTLCASVKYNVECVDQYTNTAYILLGYLTETITGICYEDMMKERIFGPLNMTTADFGPVVNINTLDQPWPHNSLGAVFPDKFSDNPPPFNSCGRIHCSIRDWASFVRLFMSGSSENLSVSDSLLSILRSIPDSVGSYTPGWIKTNRSWATGPVYTHSGSNTLNYCSVWISPDDNFAIFASTNISSPVGIDQTIASILTNFIPTLKT